MIVSFYFTNKIKRFIRRFRAPSRLVEEAGYYLTQLESAVHFLLHLKSSYVKLSDEEFDLYMKGEHPSQLQKDKQTTNPENETSKGDEVSTKQNLETTISSTTDKMKKSLSKEEKMVSVLLEEVGHLNYSFLHSSLDDISVGDISLLLREYKELVAFNESMKSVLLQSKKDIFKNRLIFEETDPKDMSNFVSRRSRTTSTLRNGL